MAGTGVNIETFRAVDANPGATLQVFNRYVDRLALLFELVFRKADGTPYIPSDREKKAMLLLKGGDDMKNLFQYVGKVEDADAYDIVIEKIRKGLSDRTNKVVQRNLLLANYPQGNKSFEKWSQEVANAAQLICYEQYDWKQATVDAIMLQTSSPRLRERALQENTSYDDLMRMGVAKEQSARGAALLEQASGVSSHSKIKIEEEVRKLQMENQNFRSKLSRQNGSCFQCGNDACEKGLKCPANGRKCTKCGKENHFAKVCRSTGTGNTPNKKHRQRKDYKKAKKSSFGQLSSAEDSESEESSGRIVVGHLSTKSIGAKIAINGPIHTPVTARKYCWQPTQGFQKLC